MNNQFNNALYRASALLCEGFGAPEEEDPTFTISTEETPAGVPTVESDPTATPVEEAPTEETATEEEEGEEKTYDVDVANPVCPCCGARLNIIDTTEETPAESDITADDIQSMDPTLEPKNSTYDVNDTFVSIDNISTDDDDEEEKDMDESFMDTLKLKKDKFFGQDKYNEKMAEELQNVAINDYPTIVKVFAEWGFEDQLKNFGRWDDFDPDYPGEFWACLQQALGWKVTANGDERGDGSWVIINGKKCKNAFQAYIAMQHGAVEG